MLLPRVAVSHRSGLEPEALLAALARRVRPGGHRRLLGRVDFLVGSVDGPDVWLRPVASLWHNPLCELAGVVEPRGAGSVLRGELRVAAPADRVLMIAFPLFGVALAVATGAGDSPAAGLAVLGVVAVARLVAQGLCARDRAEILRVVRLAEADPSGSAPRHRRQ